MKRIIVCALALVFVLSLTACSGNLKDTLIDGYNNLLSTVSKHALTKDKDLAGEREFGSDKYTGSYEAEYNRFNGEEYLFGGIDLNREDRNSLKATYALTVTEGTVELYWLAAGEPHTIASDSGDDVYEFTMSAGANYIVLKGENFSGTLTMTVE